MFQSPKLRVDASTLNFHGMAVNGIVHRMCQAWNNLLLCLGILQLPNPQLLNKETDQTGPCSFILSIEQGAFFHSLTWAGRFRAAMIQLKLSQRKVYMYQARLPITRSHPLDLRDISSSRSTLLRLDSDISSRR